MDVESDPNLVVVNLEHCVSSEGAHLGKSSCIYTTTMPTSNCHDMLQLATPVQCLSDINESLSRIQHQHLAQLQQLQYPQVQVSYENTDVSGLHQDNSLLPPPSSIYQSSTLHYSQAAPFLTSLPPQSLHILESALPQEVSESEMISLELPQPIAVEECKYPADDYDYYKEIESFLLREEIPLGVTETYVKNLKARAKHYLVTEGVLYHNPKNPKRVVMLREEQLQLLESAHQLPKTGIHQGIKKMLAVLHEKHFWRGMYVAVANFVKKCNRCRDMVQPGCEDAYVSSPTLSVQIQTQTYSSIWNEVEISIHGPFKITSGRNEFVVTIADPISCFVVGKPISQHGQCTKVTQFILHTFYTFGFPFTKVTVPTNLFEAINTELSWCLKGKKNTLKLIEQKEEIKLPWVAQLMAILLKRFPSKWDKELDRFLYQFRTGGIKQLGAKFQSTPFYAMYNRKHCRESFDEEKENLRKDSPKNQKKKVHGTVWQCRKCQESFTSRISYSFHMKQHRKKIAPVDDDSLSNSCGSSAPLTVHKEVSFSAPEDCVEITVSAVKAVLDETKYERRKRGKYQKYSAELQSHMSSFANKYGSPRAAEHFSKILGTPVSDSTIRNIVKSHSQFTPSLKEEIAKFAVNHGIDRAAVHFSDKLNKNVSVRTVRRFRTIYLNKSIEIEKKTGSSQKCSEAETSNEKDELVITAEHSVDIGKSFTPQTINCQTAACFAQPTSLAPLNQNNNGFAYQNMQVVHSTYVAHPSQQLQRDDCEGLITQHFLLVTPDGAQSSFEMSVQPVKDEEKTWVSEYQQFQVDPQVFLDACQLEPSISKAEELMLPPETVSPVLSPSPMPPPPPPPPPPLPQAAKKPSKPKKDSSGKKRGTYSTYSPEQRAEIGKYAAENGSLKASNHFSEKLGYDVAESTARALKQKYLQKVKHSDVTSLGYSPRGRPLRLGKYDEVVQECLKELFRSGEKVTSFLAITTAKEILNKFEPELLEENGGTVVLNTSWAKSFLKRIGVRNNS